MQRFSTAQIIAESNDTVSVSGYDYFPLAQYAPNGPLEKAPRDAEGPRMSARRPVLRRGARRQAAPAQCLDLRGAAARDERGHRPRRLLGRREGRLSPQFSPRLSPRRPSRDDGSASRRSVCDVRVEPYGRVPGGRARGGILWLAGGRRGVRAGVLRLGPRLLRAAGLSAGGARGARLLARCRLGGSDGAFPGRRAFVAANIPALYRAFRPSGRSPAWRRSLWRPVCSAGPSRPRRGSSLSPRP